MAGGFSPEKGASAGGGGWDENNFGLSSSGKAKGTVCRLLHMQCKAQHSPAASQ
jgi:hypothetical protein